MNRLRNIFAWCPILWLAIGSGHAQTVFWADSFETNLIPRWVSTGVWQIGQPAFGPRAAFTGANCASTERYPYNQDARIYCKSYLNGSNTLVVPDASLAPVLTFWQWYNFANALGYVELNNGTNGWQPISSTYLNVNSDGAWVQSSIDLKPYAGQSVQIGFHFTSGGCCGNALGWYVDDVAVTIMVTTPPQLTVPANQTIYAGQTLTLTNFATNTFLPHALYSFELVSPPLHSVSLTRNGVLTWTNTATTQPTSTNTLTIKVTDNSNPPLMATNSFVVTVLNPWLPVLTVNPPVQTIYAGQPVTTTCTAANDFFPGDTFTYTLLAHTTNMIGLVDPDPLLQADGIFFWQTTDAQRGGTFTNIIVATDDYPPYYSATNTFLIVVSTNLPPPVLYLPASPQTIYAGGQPLDVFVYATNTAFPASVFTFTTNSAPSGVSITAVDGNTAELTWAPAPTNKPSVKTISVHVEDGHSTPLIANGSFQVIITPTPPPSLLVPARFTNYPGQTLAVNLSATNNTGLPDSGFAFRLPSPSTNVWINTNTQVLAWTNTGISNGRLYWTNNSVSPGTRPIVVQVTDTNTLLSGTNHFDIIFLPPQPPDLTVPTNQMISFGKTFTNLLSATNNHVLLTNVSYVFALPSSSTNVLVQTNGVLTWTNIAAPPGIYGVPVKVTDNSQPPIAATNGFSVTVLPLPSQLIFSNLMVLNNGGQKFKFSIKTPWSNTSWRILAATNLNLSATNWVPVFTNKTGGSLQFTDLLATNFPKRFYRAVYP